MRNRMTRSQVARSLTAGVGLLGVGAMGCSAVVADVGGVQLNREACVQGADTEVTRDAHFVFAEMQFHAAAPTFLALFGGSTRPGEEGRQILRGRALISPSFAAGDYDPSALVVADPSRCAAAAPSPLTMDITIPDFIPPDGPNGGPFDIDFWCETNGEAMRNPGDHTWARPVCDDGDVFFVHNTGFDVPVAPEFNGLDFSVSIDPIRVAAGLRVAEDVFARLPLVVTVRRQDVNVTVGYIRTIFACDRGPYVLRGILDDRAEHALEAYIDTGLNGVYDPECDPHCTGTTRVEGANVAINFTSRVRPSDPELGDGDFDVSRFCQVPAGFETSACLPGR